MNLDISQTTVESSGTTETDISSKDWVKKLIKDVNKDTNEKILAYASIIDILGISEAKREHWTNLYKNYVTDVCDDMLQEVKTIQDTLIKEIEQLLQKSEILHKKLGIPLPPHGLEEKGLHQEKDILLEKIKELEATVKEKEEEFAKLRSKEKDLCTSLGRPLKSISEATLPSTDDFKKYLEDLESEKFRREEIFLEIKDEILSIAKQLNLKPTLEFEKVILSPNDSLFEVTDSNMKQLLEYKKNIEVQLKDVNEEIASLRKDIEAMWNLLDIPLQSRDEFRKKYVGHTLDVREALKSELKRCKNEKRENIKVFVENMRKKLKKLWDQCRFTEEQKQEFNFFESDLYTEDLLEIHEREVDKLENMLSQNSELFNLLEKHETLWKKMLELEQKAAEPNRYKNRGGQLLKEEKERNKLSKQIPTIETKLISLAKSYEERTGKEFHTWGFTIEEYINQAHDDREEHKKIMLSIRKQQRELTPGKSGMITTITPGKSRTCTALTPGKCVLSLFKGTSTQNLLTPSCASVKRKIITSSVDDTKRKRIHKENILNVPKTLPKIQVNSNTLRYSAERRKRVNKCRRLSKRKVLAPCENVSRETTISTEYDMFEKEVNSRSTEHYDHSPLALPLIKTPVKQTRERLINTPRHTPGTGRSTSKSPQNDRKLTAAPTLKLLF